MNKESVISIEKVEVHVWTNNGKHILDCIPDLKVKKDGYALTKLAEVKPITWADFKF